MPWLTTAVPPSRMVFATGSLAMWSSSGRSDMRWLSLGGFTAAAPRRLGRAAAAGGGSALGLEPHLQQLRDELAGEFGGGDGRITAGSGGDVRHGEHVAGAGRLH